MKLEFLSYTMAERKKSEYEENGYICDNLVFINPYWILWIKIS